METWRLFYDNLINRPGKTSFTHSSTGAAEPGHDWQRAVDENRNTTYRSNFVGPGVVEWDISWGDTISSVGDQWAVALFNHNARLAGADTIEVLVETSGGGLISLFTATLSNMVANPDSEIGRDHDYAWLTSRTGLNLPFDRLVVRMNFADPATQQLIIGQVMVLGGYIETRGGPTSPISSTRSHMTTQRRTISGSPSITPSLSQTQEFQGMLELLDKEEFDKLSQLIMTSKNAHPYVLHPHTNPTNGEWIGSRAGDVDIEGSGHGWMVTPTGAPITYNHSERFGVMLQGIRHMGAEQWV